MSQSNHPHILFLIPGFPAGEQDSWTVTYFVNYIELLHRTYPDHKLSVISFLYPDLNEKYEWKGIDIYPMQGGNHQSKFSKLFMWRRILKLAKKLHAKNPITAIHSLWFRECAWVATRLSKHVGVKPICTLMGTELNKKNRYLSILNPDDFILVGVSDFQSKIFENKFKKQLDSIIPWGIPNEMVSTKSDQARPFDILFAGFLNEIKNLPLFLDIISNLITEHPDLKVKIAGENYSQGKWEHQLNEQNLSKNIELLGVLKNKDMLDLMEKSKILIHTSSFETQGYVLWEAIAKGMHVVTHEVGIAKAGKLMSIANTKSEFVEIVLGLLKENPIDQAYNPYPLEKTVNSYNQLYERT